MHGAAFSVSGCQAASSGSEVLKATKGEPSRSARRSEIQLSISSSSHALVALPSFMGRGNFGLPSSPRSFISLWICCHDQVMPLRSRKSGKLKTRMEISSNTLELFEVITGAIRFPVVLLFAEIDTAGFP